MTASHPNLDFLWQARDREAALLAELLRASRLTVLYGDAGSGKTTLLKTGVLPLLRRRVSDRDVSEGGKSRVVIPFPERRSRHGPAAGDLEVVFFFDAWNEVRLTALHARMLNGLPIGGSSMLPPSRPLAESLAAWNKELGVRFLIVFDHFDDYLAAPLEREGIREFADEFARAVNDPLLPANFLVSLRDEAPLLARFQERIPGLGDASLRLPALHRRTTLPLNERQGADPQRATIAIAPALANLEQHEEAAQEVQAVAGQPQQQLVQVQAVAEQAEEQSVLEVQADGEQPQQQTMDVQTAEQSQQQPMVARADPTPIEMPLSPGNTSHTGRRPMLKWLAIPVTATALLLIVWAKLEPPVEREPTQALEQAASEAQPRAVVEELTLPPPAAPALPKVTLATDPANSTDARVAQDLARFIAPDAGVELVVRAGGPLWQDEETAPQLAIVRYDELQAARASRAADGKVGERLRVVTPLYTEEIYIITRADSPLAFIHDIRGAKINLGPAQSSRALTAGMLYERMFGAPIPAADASFLSDEAALRKLVEAKTIDAMILIAAQPAKGLADLAPETSQRIKLLKLDLGHATSSNAVEAYLPALVPAASYGSWPLEDIQTLAVMSFLVTSDTADKEAEERLRSFARSLCSNLPTLRRDGHPKWREVQPGFQLDTGWPYSAPAQAAFDSCRSSSAAGESVASTRPPSVIVRGAKR